MCSSRWTKGVAETIKEVASKYYSNSLEQYLDVNRMRSKEIQGALQRAEDFAIRLWAGREVAHSPLLAPLASLKIIAGLTRWFFEAVSKRLMKVFPRAKEGTQMILDSMLIHNAADADLRGKSNTLCNLVFNLNYDCFAHRERIH